MEQKKIVNPSFRILYKIACAMSESEDVKTIHQFSQELKISYVHTRRILDTLVLNKMIDLKKEGRLYHVMRGERFSVLQHVAENWYMPEEVKNDNEKEIVEEHI